MRCECGTRQNDARLGKDDMLNSSHDDDSGKKARRTAMILVATLDEISILSEGEHADMIVSLKAAEARIAAGEYVEHDPDTFADRLMDTRAEAIRNRKA